MNLNRVKSGLAVVDNLRSEGQQSRADYVEELVNEILRLRDALSEIKGVSGRTGEDTYIMVNIADEALKYKGY